MHRIALAASLACVLAGCDGCDSTLTTVETRTLRTERVGDREITYRASLVARSGNWYVGNLNTGPWIGHHDAVWWWSIGLDVVRDGRTVRIHTGLGSASATDEASARATELHVESCAEGDVLVMRVLEETPYGPMWRVIDLDTGTARDPRVDGATCAEALAAATRS